MENTNVQLVIRSEEMVLSPQRALFWKREQALVVSDLHLGKTGHFRQFGIPVPASLFTADLERLSALIAEFQPTKLIVVGDMFHHQRHNTDLDNFTNWRNLFEGLQILLVQGNHDRLPALQYMNMDIQMYNPNLLLHPFRFVHEPKDKAGDDFFSISGHIHPGVLLRGRAKQAIKLPCFAVNEKQIVLPAFSLFTGLDVSYCIEECDFYAIGGDGVFKV